jgi:hypothetical protein
MGAVTGVCHPLDPGDGGSSTYPLINPWFNSMKPNQTRTGKRVCIGWRLEGVAANGTDAITYTLVTLSRIGIIKSCFIVDPVGIAVDGTNYNTWVLTKTGGVTVCSLAATRGIIPDELVEIPKANTLANVTLAATNALTMVVTGSTAGALINANTLLYVVYDQGA